MPDFNDVVRHVILRIIVDSAGLAEELAKARALLKAQQQAEKESNRARAKDAEQVTDAIRKQTAALNDNARAHDSARQASESSARSTADAHRAATTAIKDETDAIRSQTAEQGRAERERDAFRSSEERKNAAAAQTSFNRQRTADENLTNARRTNAAKFADYQADLDDKAFRRQSTYASRLLRDYEAINNERARDTSNTRTASNVADRTGSEARRAATTALREEEKLKGDINRRSVEGSLLEAKLADLAERRARSAEREAAAARSRITGVRAAAGVVGDVATAVLRTPVSFTRARRAELPDDDSSAEQLRRSTTMSGRARQAIEDFARNSNSALGRTESAVRKVFDRFGEGHPNIRRAESAATGFFNRMRTGAEDSSRSLGRVSARFRAFFDDLNAPRRGGSGNSLINSFITNASAGLSKMENAFQGASRHLVSFQNLIFVVIAAFGPLAAILGAVGAAALGLGSNLVSLAGSLASLPGLIGAAVAGFGVLAAVIKPLTNVFSAYTAAQKAAAKGSDEASRAAVTAANAVQDAQRRLEDAQIAHTRAVEDAPRAELKLAEARRQAKRDIEDLRTAYQKLKFDEEGAQLDVDSAQQAYRRALVDPSATALDRRQAAHNVEGARWAQRDQATDAQRTREDYAQAMAKGVEGMDAVVAALRALTDAQRDVKNTGTDSARAQQDLNEALKDQNAGGSAARTAMDAYNAELAKLGPNTREVVVAVIGLADSYKALRNRLSERIFGQLTGDTGKFRDVLQELEAFLGPAADALGYLAHQAINLFTNPDWKAFFTEQGEENGRIIRVLGEAALSAAEGFKEIIRVARPFTDFVVYGIKGMADAFQNFAASRENREGVAAFLETTQKRMQEMGGIVRNLITGFGYFFQALNQSNGGEDDFTTWFNKGLLQASETFKELGDRARDPNGGFQKWLHDVRPLLHDIVGFLSAAGRFFGDLFSDNDNINEAKNLLKEISDTWLPQLADIFDKLSTSGIISKVADAIGKIFEALNKFLDAGGLSALSVFGDTLGMIGTILGTIIDLLGKFPGLLQVVSVAAALLFGTALAAKFSGLNLLIKGLIGSVKGIGNVLGSVFDRSEPGGRGKIGGAFQDRVDSLKDTVLGRDSGTSAARREARNAARSTGGLGGTGGRPEVDLSNTGGVLPTLYRMETTLQKIEINTRRLGGTGGTGGSGGGGGRPRPGGGGGLPGGSVAPTGRPGTGSGTRPTSPTGGMPGGSSPWRYIEDEETTAVTTGSRRPALPVGSPAQPELYTQTGPGRRGLPTAAAQPELPASTVARELGGTRTPAALPAGRTPVALPAARPQLALPAGPVRQPRDDTGRFRPTTDAEPTAELPRRDNYGRFRTTTEPAAVQPRDTSGRFRPAVQGETPAVLSRDERGRFTRTTAAIEEDTAPVRDTTGRFRRPGALPTAPVLADVGSDFGVYTTPVTGRPAARTTLRSRLSRLGRAAFPQNDEGSASIGLLTGGLASDEPRQTSRRAATTRTARTTGRSRGGLLGRLFGGAATAAADVTGIASTATGDDYNDGYNAGYSDALRGGTGGQQGLDLPDVDTDDDEQRKPSRRERRQARRQARQDRRATRRAGRSGGRFGRTAAASAVADEVVGDVLEGDVLTEDEYQDARRQRTTNLADDVDIDVDERTPRRGVPTGEVDARPAARASRGGRLARLFSRGARTGGLGSRLARGGVGLLRGAAGGLGGVAASLALSMGGDAAINHFVRDDEDAASLSRGLGAVSTGAGIGSMIGSVVPGVGTLIGGAVGGLAGGAYSLVKDRNLRNFVGGKIGDAGRAVGGAVSGAVGAVGDAVGGAGRAIGGFFRDPGRALGNMFGGSDNRMGAGGALAAATGPIGALLGKTDIGKAIIDSLDKAGGKIGEFFTRTIPGWWRQAVEGITHFFTRTLPSLPGKAFDAFFIGIGRVLRFFIRDLPHAAAVAGRFVLDRFLDLVHFFTVTAPDAIRNFFIRTLPRLAVQGWNLLKTNLVEPFIGFIKAIPGFFTETIPRWFHDVRRWVYQHIDKPIIDFVRKIPGFFTDTIPRWFEAAPGWFRKHVIEPVSNFVTVTVPNFFTVTLPNTIRTLPSVIYNNLVQPILDFFGGLAAHVGDFLKGGWNWAKGLFNRATGDVNKGLNGQMSGGFIQGVYQGIEDKTHILATPGEFYVRRSVAQKPENKQFLTDFNEGRIDVASLYGGLAAATAPQVMSIVPPDMDSLTGKVPTIVNTTINHAPLMGDVTINNPVRERSEHSLRRRLEISANRHRR